MLPVTPPRAQPCEPRWNLATALLLSPAAIGARSSPLSRVSKLPPALHGFIDVETGLMQHPTRHLWDVNRVSQTAHRRPEGDLLIGKSEVDHAKSSSTARFCPVRG